MSDLSAQLSAFKSKIKSGSSSGDRLNDESRSGTKRLAPSDSVTEVIKRQKASLGEMSSSHLSTQLHLAVEYIKQHDFPISVTKLSNYLSFDITHTLLPLLQEIDRIKFDPEANTLEYVSLHNIRNAEDLLGFLRRQTTFKGTSVKDLKDGWAGCLTAINDLEAEDKILVLRNKKENAPRMVWANLGGPLGTIKEEFLDMWSNVKLPDPDNLYQALIDQSLKPTGADPNLIKKKPQQQEKKQKKARRGKITNTHMKGILKDYTAV
ncbi:RNA polymerase II TFIIE small unit [Scheffersomyces xylosifermentans]|uniref:RNA polymerase II TFIIE small unit n=1 Tax=Scheffersomyces xylosifermentans TaxID=1304137 RepID=UPI00315CE927